MIDTNKIASDIYIVPVANIISYLHRVNFKSILKKYIKENTKSDCLYYLPKHTHIYLDDYIHHLVISWIRYNYNILPYHNTKFGMWNMLSITDSAYKILSNTLDLRLPKSMLRDDGLPISCNTMLIGTSLLITIRTIILFPRSPHVTD